MLSLALLLAAQQFESGATLRIYDIQAPLSELLPLVPGQTPNIDRKIDRIELKDGEFGLKDHFVAEILTEFRADAAGSYAFRVTSDDGASILVNGTEIALNDGVHPPTSVTGNVRLTAGWHKLVVRYFEHEGGEELKLEVKAPGDADFTVVAGDRIRVPANLTRVTSPGPKTLVGMGKRRPGSGMPLTKLHPGWDIFTCRPEDFKPQVGAMAFLPNGKLLVSNFKPNQSGEFLPNLADGTIYLVSGVMGSDRSKITVKKVAENVQEPLGLGVVGNDVYLGQRTEITRLIDTDGDEVYDKKETVAKAWEASNYHHFNFGLAAKDGYLYASLSTSITGGAPGINGPNPENRGTVMKIDPKRYDAAKPMANVEFLTGGHRTPNGIEVGPNGLILVGENQGAWQPANKLNVVIPGSFYGHYNNTTFKNAQYPNGGTPGPFDEQPLQAPALFLPQNECANSPGQSVVIPAGEFKDQMLISDVKYGGLRRGWLEQIDGVWQGGVVQYSQGFEVGTNRMVWGPDGALYIGGIGATETWAWTDPVSGKWTTYGLQRIKPNGKSTFEISAVNASADGFTVRFTRPLKGLKAADITVKQWNYEPTPEYGGDKKNRETLKVTSATKNEDGSYSLVVPGLKEGRVVYLNFDVRSQSGNELWATECWYTLNKKPVPSEVTALVVPKPRVLIFSKTTAFRHDCIEPARDSITRLFKEQGWESSATEDASVFTDAGLKNFDVVLFLCTTGDPLNDDQQAAFERFIRGGKGYVGVHSASDTEYEWPWYAKLVGAQFQSHPAIQQARIKIEDRAHPSTCFLPNNWQRVDEWYDFRANPRPNVRVLATLDETTYKNGKMGVDHPIVWCQEYDGGRSWYAEFGHTAATYEEELFRESLKQGVLWSAQGKRPIPAVDLTWEDTTGWTGLFNNGNARNIISREQFRDAHIHAEFKIPAGSNSGIYIQGRYEVQILDSYAKASKELTFADCGGIYQRFDEKTQEGWDGVAATRNAVRPAGEWNTYDISFRAPRFKNGKKVENARFVEIRLNGVVIHRNIELTGPTRAPAFADEKPMGPIMLQGDHGPVTYRNLWVTPNAGQ